MEFCDKQSLFIPIVISTHWSNQYQAGLPGSRGGESCSEPVEISKMSNNFQAGCSGLS